MTLTPQHRGLRRYQWTFARSLEVLALPLVTWLLLALCYPWIGPAWLTVMEQGLQWVGLHDITLGLQYTRRLGAGWHAFSVHAAAAPASDMQWWVALIVCLLMIAGSWFISREHLPWIYFVRAIAGLGLISVLAHAFMAEYLVTSSADLLRDMLELGQYLMWLLPLVHALVLYIFPLGWWRKLLATWLCMFFVFVSLPLHVVSLAILVRLGSDVAMMPLYMLGTFLPQLLVQLALYGWIMSLAPLPQEITDRYGQLRSI